MLLPHNGRERSSHRTRIRPVTLPVMLLLLLRIDTSLAQPSTALTVRPTANATLLPPTPTAPPAPDRPSSAPSGRPTISAAPSDSFAPSTTPTASLHPSGEPSESPTVSTYPSNMPSFYPSSVPSISAMPSVAPSISALPTISVQPSTSPSVEPTASPTRLPSAEPSAAPTVSAIPSVSPSESPSAVPSISLQPSSEPTVSMMPSVSAQPSPSPSESPSQSFAPSDLPSTTPSAPPSNFPSTTPPSFSPTLALERITSPFLEMTIYGLDVDLEVELDRRRWQQVTSDHVITYWRNIENGPFHVDKARTTLQAQERVGGGRRLQNTTFPPGVKITYRQEIEYEFQMGKDEDIHLPPFFEVGVDIFTQPFLQASAAYSSSLGRVFPSDRLIFIEYTGVVQDPTPPSGQSDRTAIYVSVTVVTFALVLASGYILYISKMRNAEERPIVGAVIGVSSSENIVVSESYEGDEYLLEGDEGGEPPDPSSRFPTLSTLPMSMSDIPQDPADEGQMVQANPSNRGSSQDDSPVPIVDREGTLTEQDSDSNREDGEDSEEGELPFMADFQLEIEDLE